MIKPKPVAPAVAGGFTVDDFTVDEAAGVVTCPAGQTRPLSPGRSVTFGALCRGLPAARPVHHLEDRSQPGPARTRRPAARRPGRLGSRPRAARGLPPPPAEHRARRLPGREPGRAAGQAALPRHQQEPRLAQAAHRGAEPAQPDRSWPYPHRPNLGPGHLNSPGRGQRPPPSESTPSDPLHRHPRPAPRRSPTRPAGHNRGHQSQRRSRRTHTTSLFSALLDAYEILIDKMLSIRRRGCPGLGRGFACRCGSSRSRGRRWSRWPVCVPCGGCGRRRGSVR